MCQNAWVKAACNTQSVQLAHLAPQHQTLEVRRVASRGAFRRLERFAEVTQQALDVVSKNAVGLDTGCGSGGFLSAFELPEYSVYESR